MRSEWIANYENDEIKITNNWFTGKKLFINDELLDEHLNLITPSKMSGILTNKKGEKLYVKTNISGFFTANCRLFIDNKKIALKQIK